MSVRGRFTVSLAVLSILLPSPGHTQDAREAARKAAADREAAMKEAREAEARILEDREALVAEVERLEAQQATLESSFDSLTTHVNDLEKEKSRLVALWDERKADFEEIQGNIRFVAREVDGLLRQSMTSAIAPDRIDEVTPILRERYFPDIEDVSTLAIVLLDEARRSGEVHLLRDGSFEGRDGTQQTGTILRLGSFSAAYRSAQETGFLEYSIQERNFAALAELPPRGMRRQINHYLDGQTDAVPVDFSGGLALRQLTEGVRFTEQIRAGGPIVYPILLIALIALAIIVERSIYLHKVYLNTDRIMGHVSELATRRDWLECEKLVHESKSSKIPVIRVLQAGLAARHEHRETMESVLQEAILRELPNLERFLSVLSVLGTIAPLLGLLGTVTGMITTFHVITLHGTGNPRIMSGGISEALVTTMLGLGVAIPIMLLHAVLSRRVHYLVGDMEEKAVALVNTLQREQVRREPELAND